MKVIPSEKRGLYHLETDNGERLRSDITHREAWRALDRIAGEPISRAEDVSDWIFRKQADA